MTPGVAVGMSGSIPGWTLEKNRWLGKALFTASHEWRIAKRIRSKDRSLRQLLPGILFDRDIAAYIESVGAAEGCDLLICCS